MNTRLSRVRENADLSGTIEELLGAVVGSGEIPAASWVVTHRGTIVSSGAVGHAVLEPERIAATPETIYDLASLTKPLITTTLALIASVEGRLAIEDPVSRFVPELAAHEHFAGTTWIDLLAHRAGFEAWYPLYVDGRDRISFLRTILARPPADQPAPSVIYSDLGFVLLFVALERVWDEDFETLARTKILEPLGVGRCGFRPDAQLRPAIAATEWKNETEREMVRARGLSFDQWREGMIWGEVNDGNAWYLGGVSGHAGLFGSAVDVARLASAYLPGCDLLPAEARCTAIACHAEGGSERRGLGWQLRSGPGTPGAALSQTAFGHTGFTGTSVWLDPDGELIVALLTNRIHPRAGRSRIREIRARLNEIVAATYL